jgi:hypothetical protein
MGMFRGVRIERTEGRWSDTRDGHVDRGQERLGTSTGEDADRHRLELSRVDLWRLTVVMTQRASFQLSHLLLFV